MEASPSIRWYRCHVPRDEMRALLQKDDRLAWSQTLGFAAVLLATGVGTMAAALLGFWWLVPLGLLAHGSVNHFTINAVHELIHETVFSSRRINRWFAYLFAFPAWNNHLYFDGSHARHHRYTLHQPDDLEVVLPQRYDLRNFLTHGILDLGHPRHAVTATWRMARGIFDGPWNTTILPADKPELRRPIVRWARTMLGLHGAILACSLAAGLLVHPGWLVLPLVTSFSNLFGGALFWLCNNTQHVGMEQSVPDARRCCRTFLVNPVVQFLYWHMNYHIEHHMFAAVPCYHLGRLHRLIRDDLPACPVGLVATWREILAGQRREEAGERPQVQVPPPRTVPLTA